MTRLGAALLLACALPALARAQDATPPPQLPTDAIAPLEPVRPEELPPQPTEPTLASDMDLARARAAQEAHPGAVFLPSPASARGYPYGVEVRYGTVRYANGQVDSSAVQLEVLFPFILESFLTPHVGASWGNFGHPAATFASRAWNVDFGLTLSWIVLSWDSYVTHAQSWFNLEIGVDLFASVQSMRTRSAAGGAVDVQSDFLLSLRPMARVVAMLSPNVSVYAGVLLSWYDITGQDDFFHGRGVDAVSHRPSEIVIGVQFSPQARRTTPEETER